MKINEITETAEIFQPADPKPNFDNRPDMELAEDDLEEVNRRDFLKGAGAVAVGSVAGSAMAQSSKDPMYLAWYCWSLSQWMTPKQQGMLKQLTSGFGNDPSSEQYRKAAGKDVANLLRSLTKKYSSDSSKVDAEMAEHARKALQDLYWAKQ
jgi:hypothetical protein